MGTGKGNAKTKSYCVKHRGYKKKGVLIITGILITVELGWFVGLIRCRSGVCVGLSR